MRQFFTKNIITTPLQKKAVNSFAFIFISTAIFSHKLSPNNVLFTKYPSSLNFQTFSLQLRLFKFPAFPPSLKKTLFQAIAVITTRRIFPSPTGEQRREENIKKLKRFFRASAWSLNRFRPSLSRYSTIRASNFIFLAHLAKDNRKRLKLIYLFLFRREFH